MDTLEIGTYTNGNERLVISCDDDPTDPRSWDNSGVMACAHNRYKLGDNDTSLDIKEAGSWEASEAWLKENAIVWLPLALYDHGGITMSVGTGGGWDSGQVGYIYAGKWEFAAAGLAWGKKGIERMRQNLTAEVEEYDQYLTGECWRWSYETRTECHTCGKGEWKVVESCGGYLGQPDKASIEEYGIKFDSGSAARFFYCAKAPR